MTSKTFYNYQPPNVDAAWLNDVDAAVYTVLGGSQTASDLRTYINAIQTSDNSINDIRLGTLANRPVASTANRIYIATDTPQFIYVDNGTSWNSLAINPSNVNITGGSITGITDLALADGGTGASTAGNARTNLGLGSIATQNSASINITGGIVTGITDLALADGGTGASTAANARTNLGLGTASTHSTSDFATAAQGGLANTALQANGSVALTGDLNFSGNALDNYTERIAPQVTDNATIDLSLGRFFPVLLSANATIAFTNIPTTGIVSFTLEIAQNATGGYSITWPTSTTFVGGTAPTPSSAANAVDTYVGYSPDQGTTWRIEQAAKGWA